MFFLLTTLWRDNQIMNTDIDQHNNTAKLWILFAMTIELLKHKLWQMLAQLAQWRHRHNVTTSLLTQSKTRVVPTSVSDVVITSLSNVIKTFPQRCCNVATAFNIGFLGQFTTGYCDFFRFIETWESYQNAK